MSIVQFVLDREGAKLTTGFTVARGSRLNSRPVAGVPCRFQTAYPVTLWPIEVEAARLDPDRVVFPGKPPEAVALLQLALRCSAGATFAQLQLDRLRFYLDGAGPLPYALYELLLNNVCGVLVRGRPAPDRPFETVTLPPRSVVPVGFDRDEGMLPGPSRSFLGYRLLQEYFAFPEKFLFFDLDGPARPGRPRLRRLDRPAVLPRPVAAARPDGPAGELPARLHAGRQPVLAGRPSRSR